MRLTTKILLAVQLLCITGHSSGLESDRFQPIKIQADSALVDESGASVYRGHVVIVQGTLQVTADEVEIYTADDEVIQIIAKTDKQSKTLAHYEQQTNDNKDMVVADARKITYLVQEERLHLSGSARLQQTNDEFEGELLYYDIAKGIVNLNSGGESDRIRMIITPKKQKL